MNHEPPKNVFLRLVWYMGYVSGYSIGWVDGFVDGIRLAYGKVRG